MRNVFSSDLLSAECRFTLCAEKVGKKFHERKVFDGPMSYKCPTTVLRVKVKIKAVWAIRPTGESESTRMHRVWSEDGFLFGPLQNTSRLMLSVHACVKSGLPVIDLFFFLSSVWISLFNMERRQTTKTIRSTVNCMGAPAGKAILKKK